MRLSFARKTGLALATAVSLTAGLSLAAPVAAHALPVTTQPADSGGYEAARISENGVLTLMEVWSGDCRLTLKVSEDGPYAGTYILEKMCVTTEMTYI